MKPINIFLVVLILTTFATATYFYQTLPQEKIASHWNANGEIDGYMSKFWGLFLMPIITTILFIIFLAIPKIDPLKNNIKKFQNHYDKLIATIIIFLTYIFALIILANKQIKFNMTTAIIIPIAILFFYIGIILKKLKRNWFIGIRTPWTISNDKVWQKTHQQGSILFKILAIIILSSAFFPKYLIWIILIPTLATIIYLFTYSYIEYKKIKNKTLRT